MGLWFTILRTITASRRHPDGFKTSHRSAAKQTRTWVRRATLFSGLLWLGTGVLLAAIVATGFWALAAAGFLLLAISLLAALSQAIRPALRPQKVRYDHSWLTNLLGQTSVPHPGPASLKSDEEQEPGKR